MTVPRSPAVTLSTGCWAHHAQRGTHTTRGHRSLCRSRQLPPGLSVRFSVCEMTAESRVTLHQPLCATLKTPGEPEVPNKGHQNNPRDFRRSRRSALSLAAPRMLVWPVSAKGLPLILPQAPSPRARGAVKWSLRQLEGLSRCERPPPEAPSLSV